MEDETLYDAAHFGGLVEKKVGSVGGYRAAERQTGVKYSTIHAIVMKGQVPNAEHFLRLFRWVTGRKLRY